MYHSVLATENITHVVPSPIEIIDEKEHGVKMVKMIPTSRATSLGSSSPAPAVIKRVCARRATDKRLLTVVNIPDELAMRGSLEFAGPSLPNHRTNGSTNSNMCIDDHKTLIELACGATLAPAYSQKLFGSIFGQPPTTEKRRTIVFIVCGGFKITLKDMMSYRAHLDACRGQEFDVWVDEEHMKMSVE